MAHSPLHPDLQQVLHQFNNLKVNYWNSKISFTTKKKLVELVENTNMDTANSRIEMLAVAVENYKKQYRDNLLCLQGENYQLKRQIEELEEKCRDFQQMNQSLIVENNCNVKHIQRLEDEIEIVENRIVQTEKQQNTQIERIKEDYNQQISEKLIVIDQLNEKIEKITEQFVSMQKRPFVHPAFNEEDKKYKNPRIVKKKIAYKWPQLDVQKTHNNNNYLDSTLNKKKRKLYHAEAGEVVDLIS